jgi:hypothetical protein
LLLAEYEQGEDDPDKIQDLTLLHCFIGLDAPVVVIIPQHNTVALGVQVTASIPTPVVKSV